MSQLNPRTQFQTAPTEKQTQKLSLLRNLKNTFLCCSSGSKDDVTCRSADKKKSKKDTHSLPKDTNEGTTLSVIEELPEIIQLDSELEDDDISVISLGEAGLNGVRSRVSKTLISRSEAHTHLQMQSRPAPIRTLAPIEPVYRKKAMTRLRKAMRNGKVADCSNTCASSEKQAIERRKLKTSSNKEAMTKKDLSISSKKQPKLAKKESKTSIKKQATAEKKCKASSRKHAIIVSKDKVEKSKKQLKLSKKKQTVKTWVEKKLSSSAKLQSSQGKLMAMEHSRIAELHKRISELKQKHDVKQNELSKLTKNGCKETKPHIKKLEKSLRKTDRKLKKLNAEVQALEEKLEQLTSVSSTPPQIKESAQAELGNRAVSDTSTTLTRSSKEPRMIIVTPGPRDSCKVQLPTTAYPPRPTTAYPPRPNTAVRMFMLPPDKTTVTPRERMVRKMLEVEHKAKEEIFERPRAAHPSRVRSLTENVQEFLPYDLEHFNSDSEDEEPVKLTEDIGTVGMRKFEELQNAKALKTTTLKKRSVRISKVDNDNDEFNFVCEVKPSCARPPPTKQVHKWNGKRNSEDSTVESPHSQ